jgi:hypothetical protein
MKRLLVILILCFSFIVAKAQDNSEYKSITITLGGSPNFIYLIPFEDQIKNYLTGILASKNVVVNMEYHPWSTTSKFLQLYGYATVANIPEGYELPSSYISSYRFSVANGKDISLIMVNNDKNKIFMRKFNKALIDATVRPR